MLPVSVIERLLLHGKLNKETGCLEWTRQITPLGYGRTSVKGKQMRVHRLAWAMAHGRMPSQDEQVCHRCDNPKCFLPSHLFLGSAADNMADCRNKGRVGSMKLSESEALAIRMSDRPTKELARQFGISDANVSRIRHGKIWTNLPPSPYEFSSRGPGWKATLKKSR